MDKAHKAYKWKFFYLTFNLLRILYFRMVPIITDVSDNPVKYDLAHSTGPGQT